MRIRLTRQVRHHRTGLLWTTAAFLVIGGLWPAATHAGPGPQSVAHVEAAFVYQFTRYVEWPEESFKRTGNAYVIAVVGDRELSEALSKLVSDKDDGERAYLVSYVEDANEAPFAHIVFIGGDSNPTDALNAGLDFEGQALTVGEHETFTRAGGIMRLYEDNSRLRIEVNIDAAKRSRLKISSKLLDLARIVRDEAD